MKRLQKWIKAREKEFGVIDESQGKWMRGYYAGWRACLIELREEIE